MSGKVTEGQLDFLGLLQEYTDEQGAIVRVMEPHSDTPADQAQKQDKGTGTAQDKETESVQQKNDDKKCERIQQITTEKKKKEAEPVQLKLDFIDLDAEFEEEQKRAETQQKIQREAEKENETSQFEAEAKPVTKAKPKTEPKPRKNTKQNDGAIKTETVAVTNQEDEPQSQGTAGQPMPRQGEQRLNAQLGSNQSAGKQDNSRPVVHPDNSRMNKGQTMEQPAESAVAAQKSDSPMLFKQCKRCWCFDCRHNSRNEGVPRKMCGSMMACPACKSCEDEDMATICEIGNAKEGCRTRALEEGILTEETPD